MSNFISVNEAVAFFYSRGFESIHHMGDGRIMRAYNRFLDEETIIHIRPKESDGVVAYEITSEQLLDMLEQRDMMFREIYAEEIAA